MYLMTLFLLFPANRIWHFMQTVSIGDNFHEISNRFLGKIRKLFQMLSAENSCLALSGQFQQTTYRCYVYFFQKTIWHLETICMKCQILFPWKIRKYFKMSAENLCLALWVQNIQHFEIFFLFFPETTNCFLRKISSTCHHLRNKPREL